MLTQRGQAFAAPEAEIFDDEIRFDGAIRRHRSARSALVES
jgi:hypothetical protein